MFSSRKEFSAASQQNTSKNPDSTGKPSNSGSILSKFIVGGVVIGAAVMTAYQTGYLDKFIVNEQHSSSEHGVEEVIVPVPKSEETGIVDLLAVPMPKNGETQETGVLREIGGLPETKEPNESSSTVKQKTEPHSDFPHVEDLKEEKVENKLPGKDIPDLMPEEGAILIQEKDLPTDPHISRTSNDQTTDSGTLSEGNIDMKKEEAMHSMEQNHGVPTKIKTTLDSTVPEISYMDTVDITKVQVCPAHPFFYFS